MSDFKEHVQFLNLPEFVMTGVPSSSIIFEGTFSNHVFLRDVVDVGYDTGGPHSALIWTRMKITFAVTAGTKTGTLEFQTRARGSGSWVTQDTVAVSGTTTINVQTDFSAPDTPMDIRYRWTDNFVGITTFAFDDGASFGRPSLGIIVD